WYKNLGNTSSSNWQKNIIVASTNNTHTVKLGDMDNDGDLDVVTGTPWSNSASSIAVRVYYNNGAGGFGAAQVVEAGKGLYSGVVYDIDGDGDLDIVGQNKYARSSKPYVYENLLARCTPPPPTTPNKGFSLAAIIMLLLE
ncbi:MAG: VCBS repeat-containing protein, partial [Arenicellales bacterium]